MQIAASASNSMNDTVITTGSVLECHYLQFNVKWASDAFHCSDFLIFINESAEYFGKHRTTIYGYIFQNRIKKVFKFKIKKISCTFKNKFKKRKKPTTQGSKVEWRYSLT